jgi:hypothetical protein
MGIQAQMRTWQNWQVISHLNSYEQRVIDP